MTAERGPQTAPFGMAVRGLRSALRGPGLTLLLLLGLSALAVAPLFVDPGYLLTRGTGESPNLLFRVHQLLRAYQAGEFPARWAADAAYGYGMPYFTYYASFSTHVAAAFKVLGLSYTGAIKLAQFAALFAGAAGAYIWVKGAGRTSSAAMLVAAAYTFAPFHLVNLYIRGDSLAELWAMGVFPWLLAAVGWVTTTGPTAAARPPAAAVALLTALLICTHNVSALTMLPLAAGYALVLAWPGLNGLVPWSFDGPVARVVGQSVARSLGPSVARLWPTAAAMGLGLALSAFFWWPALAEGEAVQLKALTSDFFSYQGHFRSLDLMQIGWLFDYTQQPFSLGLVQALLAAAGLLVAVLHWRTWSRWHTVNALALSLTLVLITPLAQPAYDHLPLLAYVQFPWRLLSLAALFTAAWTGELAAWAPERPAARTTASFWRAPGLTRPAFGPPEVRVLALSVVLTSTALAGLRPQFLPLSDDQVSAWRLQLYEVASTMIGNTANNEYLPAAVTPRPYLSDQVLGRSPSPLGAEGSRVEKRGAYERWRLQVLAGGPVSVPTHFWPGWRGQVDGRALDLSAAPGLGWITFELPPGEHEVTLWLDRTPVRAAAEALSVAALVLWVTLLLWPAAGERARRRLTLGSGGLALGAVSVMAFGLGVRAVPLDPASPSTAPPVQFDYLRSVYPARAEVLFGAQQPAPAGPFAWWDPAPLRDTAALESIEGLVERAEPGQRLDLVLKFRGGYPASVTVGLYSTAAATRELPPLAAQTAPFTLRSPIRAESDAAVSLVLPTDLAPGLYWLSPRLDGERGEEGALLPNGDVRGRVLLGPIMVDRAPQAGPPVWTATQVGNQVALDHTWQITERVPLNAGVALRLVDASGETVGAIDTQPGYGFLPSVMWRAGERIHDRILIPLTEGTAPGVVTATARLYDVSTFTTLLEQSAPVTIAPVWARGARTGAIGLGAGLALERVEFPAEAEAGTSLTVIGHWLTGPTAPGRQRATWWLRDAQGREALRVDAELTTDAWAAEAYVRLPQRLALPLDLPEGDYRVGVRVADQEVTLGQVSVRASTRQFTPPPMATRVDARFGESLMLPGLTVTRMAQTLAIDLVFQASSVPADNYTYFVHLIAPDGAVVAQVDREPRDGAYPTAGWLPGEVVVETVSFDLTDRAPGRYQLGLGWYDGGAPGLPRLPAFDATGARIVDDRLIVLDVSVR